MSWPSFDIEYCSEASAGIGDDSFEIPRRRDPSKFPLVSFSSPVLSLIIISNFECIEGKPSENIMVLFRAKIGGICVKELNNLEIEFLFGMDFNLSVKADDYDRVLSELSTLTVLRTNMFECACVSR